MTELDFFSNPSFPRTCGGDPLKVYQNTATTAVFPAPAGVIRNNGVAINSDTGFPRTCGGDPHDRVIGKRGEKFSPHLRG